MKRFLVIVVIALSIGGLFGYFMLDGNISNSYQVSSVTSTAKAFQIGVFSREENAIRVAALNKGIVVNESGLYRVYIAILKDDNAIKYMESYYGSVGINYYIRDINVSGNFINNIKELEKSILSCSYETCSDISLSILSKYEESL